jgi:hypothetical protein
LRDSLMARADETARDIQKARAAFAKADSNS